MTRFVLPAAVNLDHRKLIDKRGYRNIIHVTDQKVTSETRDRHEEFVTLLTAAHDKLLGYLMSLLGRWHDAQDVLQRSSLLM